MRYCITCRAVGAGLSRCRRVGQCNIVDKGFRAKPPNDTIAPTDGALIEEEPTMNSGTPLPGDAAPPLQSTDNVEIVNLAPAREASIAEAPPCVACGHKLTDVCARGLDAKACRDLRARARTQELASMNLPAEPGKTFETRGNENDTLAAAVQEFIGNDDDDDDPAPRKRKGTPVEEPKTRAGEFLRDAAKIVDGARNQTHGDKERSFEAIARLWTVYLQARKNYAGCVVRAKDVAAMMVLLKFARAEWGDFVPDHAVDAAGYSAIFGELAEAEKRMEEGFDDF